MKTAEDLTTILIELSLSSIKADREAIKRIETKMGRNIAEIVKELDADKQLLSALIQPHDLLTRQTNWKTKALQQIGARLMTAQLGGAIAGVVALLLIPSFQIELHKLKIPMALGAAIGFSIYRQRE